MTAIEQATEFVNRYPAMFTEDKEWWATIIALELISAQRDAVKQFSTELREGINHDTAR